MEAAERTSALLEMFSDFSGLSLNMTKSTFIAFGMSSKEMSQCARILSMPAGSLPIWYLRLSLVGGGETEITGMAASAGDNGAPTWGGGGGPDFYPVGGASSY